MGLERFERAPAISRLLSTSEGEQTLKLIKATVAPGCSDAEVGHFLELCAAYGLDPFAREAIRFKVQSVFKRQGEPAAGRLPDRGLHRRASASERLNRVIPGSWSAEYKPVEGER
jgi:hypothetical protein